MPLRFDADYGDPSLSFDPLVDEVFAELKSSFLEMPNEAFSEKKLLVRKCEPISFAKGFGETGKQSQ